MNKSDKIKKVPSRWISQNLDKSVSIYERLLGHVWVQKGSPSRWKFSQDNPTNEKNVWFNHYEVLTLEDVLHRLYHYKPRVKVMKPYGDISYVGKHIAANQYLIDMAEKKYKSSWRYQYDKIVDWLT